MAGSRKQSNAQQDEGQHRGNDVAMTSDNAAPADALTAAPEFDADAERADIEGQVAEMVGEETEELAPDQEMIKVKTTGPFMLHDPTTGNSVTEEGDEVIKTGFIDAQLELGRIVKA